MVFKVKDKYFGKESIIVTGIFDTPLLITRDEEYKILDDVQAQCNLYLFDKNIFERFMMRFDSYAVASQEKEQIQNINSTTNKPQPTKSTTRTLTKEEQEQIIRAQNGFGSGIYTACVKGQPIKYQKMGTVFMREGN